MQKNKERFNPGEAIIPGISLAFGIGYFIQIRGASMVAVKWPYMIAVLTGLLWLGVAFFFLFDDRQKAPVDVDKRKKTGRSLLILGAPLIYIGTMPYVGFAVGSFLFLTILFRVLGGRAWITNGLISVSITGFLYVTMIVLMKMSLPRLVIGSIRI